jgi:hypothetical protein
MALSKNLFGLVDSRSKQGILARGKNRYNGSGTSPNPTGINSSNAVKLLNSRRKKMKGLS